MSCKTAMIYEGWRGHVQKEEKLNMLLLQAEEWQNGFFPNIHHEFSTWYDAN